jgi:GNAT superfamily N-acetyltransferase
MIHELAEFERLTHFLGVTERMIEEALFGPRPVAEAAIGHWEEKPAAYAVFFTNFSTFLGRPGLYLEDLFVRPAMRRYGIGRAMLRHLAQICVERGYIRIEWVVLNWNEPAIKFYKSLGAAPITEWQSFHLRGDALAELAQSRGT